MLRFWQRFQSAPFYLRWPVKWLAFLCVVFFTLYPHPGLFVRELQHLRVLDSLPDPTEPTLTPVRERFDAYLNEHGIVRTHPQAMLNAVNAFVCREIRYAYDWEVWGVVDYTPTVAEVLAKRTEDCDGRAVLAAALLRAENIPARLVGDTRHMWVSTPMGETMNPLGPPIMQSGPGRMQIDWARLIDLGPPAFGMAVFPLGRELVILAAAWLLLLPLRPRKGAALLALALLLQSLFIIRMAGADPVRPNMSGIALGLVNVLASVIVIRIRPRRGGWNAEALSVTAYLSQEAP